MKDPYHILGISPAASDSDISKAFKRMARRYHPDVNPGDQKAEEFFKAITEAYSVLSDPSRRKTHDRTREAHGPHQASTYSAPSDASKRNQHHFNFRVLGEIFEDLFDPSYSMPSDARPAHGNDYLIRLSVELRDTILGADKIVRTPNGQDITVHIPIGTESGALLRFPSMGEPGEGNSQAGDLIVEIAVRPDERFERRGEHLTTQLKVPLSLALLGGTIPLSTWEDRFELHIPPGSQSGDELRLKGKGAFNFKTRSRGDLLVHLDVHYPTRFHPNDRETLLRILERTQNN